MRWRTAQNHRQSANNKYRRRFEVAKKVARLGLSYSMSIQKMAIGLRALNISTKDANEAVKSFRRQYIRGQKWRKATR